MRITPVALICNSSITVIVTVIVIIILTHVERNARSIGCNSLVIVTCTCANALPHAHHCRAHSVQLPQPPAAPNQIIGSKEQPPQALVGKRRTSRAVLGQKLSRTRSTSSLVRIVSNEAHSHRGRRRSHRGRYLQVPQHGTFGSCGPTTIKQNKQTCGSSRIQRSQMARLSPARTYERLCI
jgi:hypothetical protein